MKTRNGKSIIAAGALLCALACAAPLLGLGVLGLAAGLEWLGVAVIGLGAVVALVELVRRRSAGCADDAGSDHVC